MNNENNLIRIILAAIVGAALWVWHEINKPTPDPVDPDPVDPDPVDPDPVDPDPVDPDPVDPDPVDPDPVDPDPVDPDPVDPDPVDPDPVDPDRPGSFFFGQAFRSNGPIDLYDVQDKVIDLETIDGTQHNAMKLDNCHGIVFENNEFFNVGGNTIELYQCSNVTVKDNFAKDVGSFVYANECGDNIVVTHNSVSGINGPMPRGQLVQLNTCSGEGIVISYNIDENEVGNCGQEDAISVYNSQGTKNSPILVSHNWIRGGGPSEGSGGITVGDNGGKYIDVLSNIMVNPGAVGLSVPGGENLRLIDNIVFSVFHPWYNTGAYFMRNDESPSCRNITAINNKIAWLDQDGTIQSGVWNASDAPASDLGEGEGTCGNIIGFETNDWEAADVDASILPVKLILQNG